MKKTRLISFITSLILLSLILGSNAVLAEEIEASQEAAIEAKVSEDLQQRVAKLSDNDTISLGIFMTDVDENAVMKEFLTKYPTLCEEYIKAKETDEPVDDDLLQQAIEKKRAIFAEHYTRSNEAMVEKFAERDEIDFLSKFAPTVIIETECGRLGEIAALPQVVSIDYYDKDAEVVEFLSDATTESRTKYNRDTLGLKGSGVKIGLVDSDVPSPNNAYLQNADITYYNNQSYSGNYHASGMAEILVGSNGGIVPNAKIYAGGVKKSSPYTFNEIIEWMVTQGVNVISCSIANTRQGLYIRDSKWIDHLAVQHDIHFVIAAGNTDNSSMVVSDYGMAYNAITVGAYDEKDTTDITVLSNNSDDTMYSYSCYKEAERRTGTDTSNNPYCNKPNLVAPGVGVLLSGGSLNGTSISTPIVAGAIAQLCCYNSALKTKQTAVSAMLMASAALKVDEKNNSGKAGDVFRTDDIISGEPHRHKSTNGQISNREGAGKLNARRAYNIAKNGDYWSYTKTGESFTQDISVTLEADKVTRVALFWLKRVVLPSGHPMTDGIINDNTIALSDLVLRVYDSSGTQIKYSAVANCNYQIVQFTPETSGTYKIRVQKNSGADKDHFGVALWHK